MTNKLTMKDIAKATGVSQPTVSRIINGSSSVSSEKKEKVLAYIEEVGYRPNLLARSLKNNNSYLLGICVPNLLNPYFIELLDTMEELGKQCGYSFIIHNAKKNPVLEWEAMMDFVDRQVDGVVLIPSSTSNLKEYKKLSFPIVIATQTRDEFDSVAVSHTRGGEIVAGYLLKNNKKNVAYIGGNFKTDTKYKGFVDEMKRGGGKIIPKYCLELSEYEIENSKISHTIEKFLKNHTTIDVEAYFTGNDIIALELIKILEKKCLEVPEDIEVIGFDNTIIAKTLSIPSVEQSVKRIGEITFEFLKERIGGSKAEIKHKKIDPQLKISKK